MYRLGSVKNRSNFNKVENGYLIFNSFLTDLTNNGVFN